MSGVYIKGMEMPQDGRELIIRVFQDGTIYDLHGIQLSANAIPVPEHGDLIDRDALKNACKENAKSGIGLWVDYMDVSLAPTIIPAEE